MSQRIAAMVFALACGACSTMSPEQCRNADWRQVGYADGVEGYPGSRIQDHASACAASNVTPDLTAYLAGRADGLRIYCQPEKGFDVGRKGRPDNAGDCPEPMRSAFLEQYQRGRQINAIESEISSLSSSLENERRMQRRNDDRIDEIRKELGRQNLDPARRNTLLEEMNRIVERKEDNGRRRLRLQRDIDDAQRRLDDRLRGFGR
ncbi:DUF2799 domain-containing protein [Noviherbaspirillum pedocola]|uniref:DUF2799 domain-containing protein n=1 Tax=Noviherbaspirillum pedocola TaxID=2801341 RepID=A0A934SRK5_9BURK|nr:DUF2799 domain-containing protein [Noviherbaspirillum pedocola]MBK4734195.1 DUF2799 domain-containing protein [Noviherbaspirillum pedocola]